MTPFPISLLFIPARPGEDVHLNMVQRWLSWSSASARGAANNPVARRSVAIDRVAVFIPLRQGQFSSRPRHPNRIRDDAFSRIFSGYMTKCGHYFGGADENARRYIANPYVIGPGRALQNQPKEHADQMRSKEKSSAFGFGGIVVCRKRTFLRSVRVHIIQSGKTVRYAIIRRNIPLLRSRRPPVGLLRMVRENWNCCSGRSFIIPRPPS
jgi:hypothetical protein